MSDLRRYTKKPFPSYAFVPGRHPHPTRDPRGHSYGEQTAAAPLDETCWQRCEPYLYGIDLFNHGYWWEAHEALEPLWLAAGQDTPTGRFLQGLIQAAAALLKHSMGSPEAARALAESACEKLGGVPMPYLGIDVSRLTRELAAFVDGRMEMPPTLELG